MPSICNQPTLIGESEFDQKCVLAWRHNKYKRGTYLRRIFIKRSPSKSDHHWKFKGDFEKGEKNAYWGEWL